LFCFVSLPFFLLASCASTNFLQNKALSSTHACPLHMPKMPNNGYVMHRGALYVN
jgi:hypothetical protein